MLPRILIRPLGVLLPLSALPSLLLLLALLCCVGCGTRAPLLPANDAPVRVGVSRSSKSFRDDQGKLAGLYVDVFTAAAGRAKVPFVFVDLDGRSIDQALQNNEIDIHVAAANFPSRHHPGVYLAEPWWASPLVAVVPRQSTFQKLDDLAGQKVAVGQASVGYWEALFPQAIPKALRYDVPAPRNPIEALCTGEAEAVLTVGPDAENLLGSRPDPCRQMDFRFLRASLAKVHYSLMSRAAQRPLAELLNTEIRLMAADGNLARISSPWLGLNSAAADELSLEVNASRRLERTLTLTGMAAVGLLSLLFAGLLWRERRVARHMEIAMEQARRGEQAKAEFLAMMSHEIRTPLNGVLGMTEIILTSPLNPEQLEAAQTIHRSSVALLTVLNDVLDLASADAGPLRLNPEPFALRLLLDDVMNLLSLSARAKNLRLYVEVAADVPSLIVGDPTRLRQILLNLAGNAVKFTDRGRVFLRVSCLPDESPDNATPNRVALRFSVEDSGPGIRADQLPLLFRRFTQLDSSSTRRHGGTGLGLAISKALVETMGGQIDVTSVEGVGSQFFFTLSFACADASGVDAGSPPLQGKLVHIAGSDPDQVRCLQLLALAAGAELADEASAQEHVNLWIEPESGSKNLEPEADGIPHPPTGHSQAQPASARMLQSPVSYATLVAALAAPTSAPATTQLPASDKLQQTTPPFAGRRILIAEDNAVNRRLLSTLLGKLGCTLLEASNGQEAVDLWRTQHPDLILMDCQMPGIDGYEATRRIRAEESAASKTASTANPPSPISPTPIWAVTANVFPEDRQRCLNCGMNNLLAKPFTLAQLEATLHAVFGADTSPNVPRISP